MIEFLVDLFSCVLIFVFVQYFLFFLSFKHVSCVPFSFSFFF